ncbi:DUF4405 domain-containing protein [uncultured Desulfobulbus sp.]|uniref:DUF4405 domain-containing protein n=1 Tax=uncultured Desulfobulbus sp. TaxID=239745 RepID=UPI0029C6D88F|nr:DUF4405 domain-containing protein [uncultured Desulfobulbus sp.]
MNTMLTTDKKPISRNSLLREWATPFTMGAFALSALTGVLLFFKINLGLVKPVHEWLSWFLVIGTVFHLLANWRPTVLYFSRPVGKTIFVVFLLLICGSLLPFGAGGKRQHPASSIAEALTHAPLSAVAQVANHSPDETLALLKTQGINLFSGDPTIQEIADNNHRRALDLLAVIF